MAISRRALLTDLLRAVAIASAAAIALFGARAARPAAGQRKKLDLARDDVRGPILSADVVVVAGPDGELRAWSRRCTHLGCLLELEAEGTGLICPCHGSRFDLAGHRIAGPARADLTALELRAAPDGSLSVR